MTALSVIVPVYNKEAYVEQCIKSILDQSFTDFELILVNDGSTDKSAETCWEYDKLDPRIIVLDQQNMGVSTARNNGIAIAKGKFIGFVDSDDSIEPDMYQLLMNNALATDADISGCRLCVIKNEKKSIALGSGKIKVYNHTNALAANLRGEFDSNANNKIYRASVIKSILFEGKIYEDILFVCKAFIKSNKTIIADVVMYNYMIRDNSTSMRSFNKNYLETIMVSGKIVELVAENDPECLEEAKAFDVLANISLLNLLLLIKNQKTYAEAYEQVTRTLWEYNNFIKKSPAVRKKHKYAWRCFSLSPMLYRYLMKAYCIVTNADVITRTQ